MTLTVFAPLTPAPVPNFLMDIQVTSDRPLTYVIFGSGAVIRYMGTFLYVYMTDSDFNFVVVVSWIPNLFFFFLMGEKRDSLHW